MPPILRAVAHRGLRGRTVRRAPPRPPGAAPRGRPATREAPARRAAVRLRCAHREPGRGGDNVGFPAPHERGRRSVPHHRVRARRGGVHLPARPRAVVGVGRSPRSSCSSWARSSAPACCGGAVNVLDVFGGPVTRPPGGGCPRRSPAFTLAIWNLWYSRWWRKLIALLAIPLFALTALLGINASYGLTRRSARCSASRPRAPSISTTPDATAGPDPDRAAVPDLDAAGRHARGRHDRHAERGRARTRTRASRRAPRSSTCRRRRS